MLSAERDLLAAECRTFSTYLIGREPAAYVIEKYCQAHAAGNILHIPKHDALDAILVRVAARRHFFTRVVDLYTSLFFKHALVRKKLVLLLAILESASATHAYFDVPDPVSRLELGWLIVQRGLVSGAALLVSLVSILPLHLGLRARNESGLRGVRDNGGPAPRAE
jgi:hypothetical protein